jgi:hypothetical protein
MRAINIVNIKKKSYGYTHFCYTKTLHSRRSVPNDWNVTTVITDAVEEQVSYTISTQRIIETNTIHYYLN